MVNGSSAGITRMTHSMQSIHNLCHITGTTKRYWAVAWSPGLLAEQASMQGCWEAPLIGQQSDSRGLKTPVCSFPISTVYFVRCLTHTLWSKIGILCPYRHCRIILTLSPSLFEYFHPSVCLGGKLCWHCCPFHRYWANTEKETSDANYVM